MSASAGVALDLEPMSARAPGSDVAPRPGRARLYAVPDELVVGRPAGTSWRLTRRGRAVLLGLLVVFLVVVAVGWGAATANGAATDAPQRVTVVVGDGDTLWSIAADVAPDADRRATIERIKRVNDLRGTTIEPGQQLVVPVHAS